MARILVIGVAVEDFVFQVEALPSEARKYRATDAQVTGGGCAANAAVAIARLGGKAVLGARLGSDHLGDIILSDLARDGVDTDLVQRTEGARSSFNSVYVDTGGERQIMNYRGSGLGNDTSWIAKAPPVDAVLADTRWTDGAMAALALARDRGVPAIVDAEAPMDERVLEMASHVAFSRDGLLSFASGSDIPAALSDAAARLDAWVCVTDGENGAWYFTAGGTVHVPAFGVDVKDTLGAGDVWHGAFALALAEGSAAPEAVLFANAVAALKCTEFGGRNGTPTRGEVENFLKEKSP